MLEEEEEEEDKSNNEERKNSSRVGFASPYQPYHSPTYGSAAPAKECLRGEFHFDSNQTFSSLISFIFFVLTV